MRGRLIVLAVGLALSLAGVLALRSPETAERLCAGGLTAQAGILLSRVSAPLPTSGAEMLLAALAVWAVARGVRGIIVVRRGGARLLPSVGAGALWAAAVLSVFLASFFPLFGVAYARRPLALRLGWSEAARAPTGTADELCALAGELVQVTNDAYERAAGSRDLGRPSAPTSPALLDLSLEASYGRVAARFGLDDSVGAPRGPAKGFLVSRTMTLVGLGGVYFPWTGEANVNAEEPWCALGHTIAHEKAHQRMIASEDEANFMGFLACALADDPYARYSGLLFAERQLLFEMIRLEDPRVAGLVKRRHPGVQRDVDDHRAWVRRFESKVTQAASAVNNAYLKANGVSAGIASYGLSARLIVGLARTRGGTLAGLTGEGR